MSDPDVEREEQIARDYLIHILGPRVIAGVDPDQVADHFVAWLRREREWWPALRPPERRPPGTGVPANDDFHAALAELARPSSAENS